jgi:RNA polymerase sigma-70 factor (ECF subfamily)
VTFFVRRGHDVSIAEDLAQEVMLTVYQRADQLRNRTLFRAWLFKIARSAACRLLAKRRREVPTVNLADIPEMYVCLKPATCWPEGSEFRNWLAFLDPQEREVMALRFEEEWEYHEIAASSGIPIGTLQWRVFNSKKKLAAHLSSQ